MLAGAADALSTALMMLEADKNDEETADIKCQKGALWDECTYSMAVVCARMGRGGQGFCLPCLLR